MHRSFVLFSVALVAITGCVSDPLVPVHHLSPAQCRADVDCMALKADTVRGRSGCPELDQNSAEILVDLGGQPRGEASFVGSDTGGGTWAQMRLVMKAANASSTPPAGQATHTIETPFIDASGNPLYYLDLPRSRHVRVKAHEGSPGTQRKYYFLIYNKNRPQCMPLDPMIIIEN